MELVLGIDLGTSYFKLGLFDPAGKLCGLGRVFIPKDIGPGSWCELPTERFWSLLGAALAQACQQASAQPADIQALAYSSQANGFVLLDDNDTPLTPLILWPDSRVEHIDPVVQQLWQRNDFLQTTGLGMDLTAIFCLAKLRWLKHNQPDTFASAKHIMTISDYLTYCLTGQAVGDLGTTALLGTLDLPGRRLWAEALDLLQLDPRLLSTPLLPGTIAGAVTAIGSEYLSVKPGIPFVIGSLDHHVAAIGAGAGPIADLSVSMGTVLACLHYSNDYHPLVNNCMGPGLGSYHYYQLAFNENGADTLQWYQQNHAPDMTIEQLTHLAASAPLGCDGLVALAQACRYDDLLGFKNISPSHKCPHFVRAIMESTAFTLAQLLSDLCPARLPRRIVATGGGAMSDFWLQINADVLNTEFVTTHCQEPACMGAAMLASVAAGWFADIDSVGPKWIKINKRFHPDPDNHRLYANLDRTE